MRTLLTGSIFALALLVAACGGGGTSSVVPSGANPGGANQPSSAKSTNARIVLNIPPPNRQVSRRPFYLSSGTQSLGVLVVPATSTETPTPLNLTIFPVATPSPCAAASGGGYTCTLNVTAPIGVDNFFVGAFATASPNANAVPLSEYIALNITVSASPAPGATPLTFTLDGVVYKVALAVPSPDPGNTPNTQVFPAGVPVSPLPLGITAYDSSNTPILTNVTNTFATPIAIAPSPAGDGVSLLLNGATCSSITNGAVSINCAADLSHVQFAYDGTPRPDANDHIIDAFTIASTTQQSNPTPAPAYVMLSSNVVTYQIPTSNYTEGAFLKTLASGQLLYVAYTEGSALIGTFTPSTGTVGAPGTLNVTSQDDVEPSAVAVTTGNAVWVIDEYNYPPGLDCWTSLAGGTASQSAIQLFDPTGEYALYPSAIAVDGANNLWYVGYESETGQNYAGYFPESSACATPTSVNAEYTLTGDTYDSSPFVAPLANGIVYDAGNGSGSAGLYTVTTTGSSSVTPVAATLGGSAYGGGVGLGADGAAYASFYNSGVNADLETMASGGLSLTALLDLVPTSPVDDLMAYPYGLNVFSLNGVGDRVNYVDDDFQALGLVGNLQTTPTTMLDALPNAFAAYQSTHSANGGEFVIYQDESENLYIARAYQTTTWNVPATVIGGGGCGETGLLSMNQRAPSSGPFTVSVSGGGSATVLPGSYNDYLLNPSAFGTPFAIQVTDAGGRTESYTLTFNEGEDC
jgi:hypothetical protein